MAERARRWWSGWWRRRWRCSPRRGCSGGGARGAAAGEDGWQRRPATAAPRRAPRSSTCTLPGAVRRPGLLRLPAGHTGGQRAGEGRGADSREPTSPLVNLAAKVQDGQQIVVPVGAGRPERAAAADSPGCAGPPLDARPRTSSTRSTASARRWRSGSSSTATPTAASARSTSWHRWTASGRSAWPRCATHCSHEAGDTRPRRGGGARGRAAHLDRSDRR